MRNDFTNEFTLAKNKRANEPVTLIQLVWPAIGSHSALTLYLADRNGISIEGTPWYPLIQDPGDIRRLVDTARLIDTPSASLRVVLANLKTSLFTPPSMFSNQFRFRPIENCVATVKQWFGSEGLSESDIVDIFVGAIEDPIRFNETRCSFSLVNISSKYGRQVIGDVITLDNYLEAPDASVGKVMPLVFGLVEDTPSILVRKSQQTKLKSVSIPGGSILDVSSTEDFPASGTVILNDDEITYTAINSTQFLGCSGINEYHYADDIVLEKVTDHRYLLNDPAYPIKSISNVKVAGNLADSGDFTIDLPNGEVVFNIKPVGSSNNDTKFLQVQFDQAGAGNNATDPLNAILPNAQTTYAKISSANNLLAVEHSPTLPNIGDIGKVFLRVEHFVEEKLPNDSLEAHIVGIGKLGDLSSPATADSVITVGSTNITHSHLDTFGFPITDPQHFHAEASPPSFTQNALSGTGGLLISKNSGQNHLITFPDPGSGTWATAEYGIGYEWAGTISGGSTVYVHAQGNGGGPSYQVWIRQNSTETYTTGGNISSDINTIRITHTATFITYYIRNATRVVTMTTALDTSTKPTSNSTSKTGALTQHGSSPTLSATTEGATRSVVDFFDITSNVNGDWNWFTGKEAQIKYIGSSDGRTAFIVHVAYEIEYARRRIEFTDDVTADVEGIKDDEAGSVTGTPDLLLEKPHHLFKWSILKALGLDAGVIDTTSIDVAGVLMDAAIDGGYKFGGIVQNKIEARTLWKRWGKECRSYFYWELGKAKALYRPLNLVTPSTPCQKAIADSMIPYDKSTGISIFEASRTKMEGLVNHIDMHYKREWSDDEYKSLLTKIEGASVEDFGKREKPDDYEFDWIRIQDMADHVAEFYIRENCRPTDIYEFDLFMDNMEVERGDVVWVNPPTHDLDNVKMMVLGVGRVLGSGTARRMDKMKVVGRLIPGTIAKPGFGQQAFGSTGFGGRYLNKGFGQQAFGSSKFGGEMVGAGFGQQAFGSEGFGGIENV